MVKRRHFALSGSTSFLLIVCWLMAVQAIRCSVATPVASSDEIETALASAGESDQDEARIDELLNAVERLAGRLDDAPTARHEQRDTWAAVAKREEAPVMLSGGVNRLSAHATGLHARSALNKNFIRFGRSGAQQSRRALAIEKLRRAMLDQSDVDNGDSLTNYSHFPRSSRGLQSNFIRFGRSVPAPDNSNAQ